jgi:Tfp pilus assembly protein PilF
MVKFPKGHIQVLDIAWDSRLENEGGQRWFHIHQDDNVTHDDVLHWSGQNFNWNYMCADCHSTNLKKNYDAETKSYHTTYDLINVSCEACHGEGSEHVAWVKDPKSYKGTLKYALKDLGTKNRWKIDNKSAKPILLTEIDRTEVEMCAKCHSRRSQLDDDFSEGKGFHDNYLPSLLTDQLYFEDGKIKDEVYVYGSFVQSKMYDAGVSCSDCHDPHSLERHGPGDNVCNKCHVRSNYDTPRHHHHKRGEASCIDCHMPSRVYMGVDERNDHSFRVPRPDLSDKIKAPNACNNCHTEKSNAWSVKAMKKWYGEIPKGHQDFAHQLHSLHKSSDTALQDLYSVLMSDAPDIAKATVTAYLSVYPSRQTLMTAAQKLRSSDPRTRIAALNALAGFPAQHVVREIFQALEDPVKSVRIEAVRILLAFDTGSLTKEQQRIFDKALTEYRQVLLFSAERPEAQVSLAALYTQLGNIEKAEEAYKEAIRLQKYYVPGYVNYANFLQHQGNEKVAFEVIQKGLKQVETAATLYEALGLWYVRNKEREKGVKVLGKAHELAKDDAHIQYVYAVAVADKDREGAIAILENSLKKHSGHLETLSALAYYYEQSGNMMTAERYRQKIQSVLSISVKGTSKDTNRPQR